MRTLSQLRQDVIYGIRTLLKSLGYALVALISLSLAIAIATCAFSEVNGLILRDIPSVPEPDQLVALSAPQSYPFYQRWAGRRDLFRVESQPTSHLGTKFAAADNCSRTDLEVWPKGSVSNATSQSQGNCIQNRRLARGVRAGQQDAKFVVHSRGGYDHAS